MHFLFYYGNKIDKIACSEFWKAKDSYRQLLVIDEAEKYQNERDKIIADNEELHNKMFSMEIEYQNKSKDLDLKFEDEKQKLENEYSEKFNNLDNHFYNIINNLEKENNRLNKLLDKFKETFHKFVNWICNSFSLLSFSPSCKLNI